MKKPYTALTKVNHDQEDYLAGSRIDLDDKQAKPLLDLGAIASGYDGKEQTPDPASGNPPNKELTEAEKLDAVKAVLGSLNVDNAEIWTSTGKPNTAALTGILGFDVSAALRDAAWAEHKPAA